MSQELSWLAWTVLMTALFPFPYVLNRIAVRGLGGAMANPAPTDPPLAAWAERAQRAHANAVENLVLFAPAVLLVQLLGRNSALTSAACALYFGARLLHYVVYTAGIPVLRTLCYFGGLVAVVLLVLRVLGWM